MRLERHGKDDKQVDDALLSTDTYVSYRGLFRASHSPDEEVEQSVIQPKDASVIGATATGSLISDIVNHRHTWTKPNELF